MENILSADYLIKCLTLIVRLVIAAICGYVIGYERKNQKKEAGIRTHIIVAIASCLMMEISKYGFEDLGHFDGARIAAQVVSGIGFLGAGMIFVQKNSVKGLTTAAGIWATSGIGLAVGAGMYLIGIVTTLLIMVLQILFHNKSRFIKGITSETFVIYIVDAPDSLDRLSAVLKEGKIICDDISIKKTEDKQICTEMHLRFDTDFDIVTFTARLSKEDFVCAVHSA